MSGASNIVGAAIGGLGAFGGSGGEGTTGSQQSTMDSYSYQKPSTYAPTAQGYLDQIPVYQAAGQQAMQALNAQNAQNRQITQPLIQSSYGAYDNLLDSLGIARPEEGSYAYSTRKNAYDTGQANLQSAQDALYKSGQTAAKTDLQYFNMHPNDRNQGDFGLNALTSPPPAAQTAPSVAPVAAPKSGLSALFGGLFGNPTPRAASPSSAGVAYNGSPNTDMGRVNSALMGAKPGDLNSIIALGQEAQHNLDQQYFTNHAYNGGTDPYWTKWFADQQAAQGDYQSLLAAQAKAPTGPFQDATMTDAAQQSAKVQAMLEADPNYQFQLNQGNKSIQAMAAASGMGNTPRVAQELQTFGQGQAASAMQTYRDRLSSIMNQGMQAMGMQVGSNTNTGNALAGNSQLTGSNVAGSTANATNQWQVGPITQEQTQHQQSTQQTSGGGNSMLQNVGNGARALTGFLSAL